MASGRLGASDLAATTNTTVYTVPASKVAVATVSLCNRNAGGVAVRLAISTSGTPANADYIEYDTIIPGNTTLERSGLVMGEGAGCAVLESLEHARVRGATILAEVTGYGTTLDAWRITAPEPEGKGAAHAMRAALADGGLEPGDVDFVNAHGTGTKRNDPAEVHAVKGAFGEHASRLAVTSSKGALGHLLSGAAGVAFVACVSAVQRQAVPPTANLADPDRHCDIDHVPGTGRAMPVRAAMNDAFAFGGQNAWLLVSRFEEAGRGSKR